MAIAGIHVAVKRHESIDIRTEAADRADDGPAFALEVAGDLDELVAHQMAHQRREPTARIAVQRRGSEIFRQEGEGGLAVLDALAGDVADLHGGECRRDLRLHEARGAADLAGKLREMAALGGKIRRIARGCRQCPARCGGSAPAPPAPGGRSVDHAAERADPGAERIDLARAEMDALEDLFREARKVRDGGAGDLGCGGEGAEIPQRLLHVRDMGAERLLRHRDAGKALLAGLLDGRQGGELVDRRDQPADRRLGGLVVERLRQVLQRRHQAVEHVEDGKQHDAAVEEALFDAGTGPFETGDEFRLGRLPLNADCARCS